MITRERLIEVERFIARSESIPLSPEDRGEIARLAQFYISTGLRTTVDLKPLRGVSRFVDVEIEYLETDRRSA